MNILITGASGMLGKNIFSIFFAEYINTFNIDKELNPNIPQENQIIGDLMNEEFTASVLNKINPDLIIHCAAIVNLNLCESNKSLANNLHISTTKWLSVYKKGLTKIIYISTDSVFDGEIGNYSETDNTNPVNHYAFSKLEGEKQVALNSNHIIIRTNIFGYSTPLKGSFVEWAISNFKNNESITGFKDVSFNAIYTKQLAKIIHKLFEVDFKGLINVASSTVITKYDFLVYLAKSLEYSESLVKEGLSSNINFAVKRPLNTTLNINKVKEIIEIPSIEQGINELAYNYLNEKAKL